jgi:cytochrome c oxidase cbb3-type subunit IV
METWTYDEVQEFVHSWGLVYFTLMFLAAAIYAYWPKNKKRFQDAARIPFEDEDSHER